MSDNIRIIVLDKDFNSIHVVEHYTSFIWTDRYNTYGDFELYMPLDTSINMDEVFQPDNYLWCSLSEHIMLIDYRNVTTSPEDGDMMMVRGVSAESILARRICWGQTIVNGNFQNGVKQLLDDNIIAPKIEERKIDNFRFVDSMDPEITKLTLSAQYTGDNVYDIISDLCDMNGLGFKVSLDPENNFIFSLYKGIDRSFNQDDNSYVIFSPKYNNILNSNYVYGNRGLKNVTLVAGEGEGSERRLASYGTVAGLQRRELFTDARDISSSVDGGTVSDEEYTKMLEARGSTNLEKCKVEEAFEGKVDATQMFTLGQDFFIGDTVQIINEYGKEETVYISEIVFSHDDTGLSIYPTFKSTKREEQE